MLKPYIGWGLLPSFGNYLQQGNEFATTVTKTSLLPKVEIV